MTPRTQWRILNRDGSFNLAREDRARETYGDVYHRALSTGWIRFLLLLTLIFFVLNVLFALAYYACGPDAISQMEHAEAPFRLLDCFFFSVQTFATIGFGRMAPVGVVTNLLVVLEALIGIFYAALATGLLFSRFSRPTARVRFASRAIIAPHDGVPSLVFRMANARLNQIAEAQVSVVLSRDERTLEGEEYRTLYNLKLERERTPVFALTWTVVHPINPDSPLHGVTEKQLRDAQTEILVSVSGTDDTFAQTIHARTSYVADEIVWGGTYGDMLSRDGGGRLRVRLERLDELEGGREGRGAD